MKIVGYYGAFIANMTDGSLALINEYTMEPYEEMDTNTKEKKASSFSIDVSGL